MGPAALTLGPPLISGVASLLGGRQANKARREESQRNRNFQERMRNTQWQAAVADMDAAGLNPALAYSQGPNAAPGGSMAQQMDAVSPAVSSALQSRRMEADLSLVREQVKKARADTRSAEVAADMAAARFKAYGVSVGPDGGIKMDISPDAPLPLMTREILAAIRGAEAGVLSKEAGTAYTGQKTRIATPMAELSENMGMWLPILGLLSQLSPGGMLRALRRPKGITETIRKGPKGLTTSITRKR